MTAMRKDGTPRAKGSGRTKGAVSLVSVKLSDLTSKFKADDLVVCGRVFLSKAGIVNPAPAITAPTPADGITLVP